VGNCPFHGEKNGGGEAEEAEAGRNDGRVVAGLRNWVDIWTMAGHLWLMTAG
jgi:hypothetical protein